MIRHWPEGIAMMMTIALGWQTLSAATLPSEEPVITVTAQPLPPWVGEGAFDGVRLDAEKLRQAAQPRLDAILREVPGFRLFRRTDSIGAHPTAQGVSLRNVGPSGVSRTAVLLDGVPISDPFGGWVPWSRFTPAMLAGVSVVRDGGVSPWGTGSLGGVIALESRYLAAEPFTSFEAAAGNVLEHSATLTFAEDSQAGATRLFGGLHHSTFSGYPVIAEGQRGAVDGDAFNETQWFEAGARHQLDEHWRLTLRVAGWSELRGNGTPLADSSSESLDFSASLQRAAVEPGDWSAEWIVYHQRRGFQSRFTSIAEDRRSERLVLDQYDVPAQATGFIHRLRLPLADGHLLSAGLDLRHLDGETREHFANLGQGFTRQRIAGGTQWDTGLFVQDTWDISPAWQLHAGARADWYRDAQGSLRERPLSGSGSARQETYASRDDLAGHARLGTTWNPLPWLQARVSSYLGARQPTLNELYRPFRVGNLSTLANPALKPERIAGLDLGLRADLGAASWVSASLFYNEVRDAVANVTQAIGPGLFPPWGELPAGGIGARRENLDATRIMGLEVEGSWQLREHLSLTAAWLATESQVLSARIKPRLVGKALAQVPQHQASLGLAGDLGKAWHWSLAARWVDAAFDDDLNTRPLADYLTLDARVSCQLSQHTELYASIENALDSEIQTRRDPTGLVAIGAPRMWMLGLRVEF